MTLSPDDLDALRYAKRLLENPGLAAKITNVLGRPIESGIGGSEVPECHIFYPPASMKVR
jgi:hypothetical protein